MEERFKNLESSSQILESPAPPGAKASSSILDYYMFWAMRKVVSLAVVTHAQSVSQTTSSTTKEPVETLWARNNGSADQIGQAHLP